MCVYHLDEGHDEIFFCHMHLLQQQNNQKTDRENKATNILSNYYAQSPTVLSSKTNTL